MPRVYIDAVMDLFHFGHVSILKSAHELSRQDDPDGTLIVGIHSDSDVESYKRRPVMAMGERIAVVKACRYVDEVVGDAPLRPSKSYLKSLGVDLVVHGGSLSEDLQEAMYGEARAIGIYREFPYTDGISTTEIIKRCKDLL